MEAAKVARVQNAGKVLLIEDEHDRIKMSPGLRVRFHEMDITDLKAEEARAVLDRMRA